MPQHVGFWKEKVDSGWYPGKKMWKELPIANSATEDQTPVLVALQEVENLAVVAHYLGPSPCRICGGLNGNREYTYNEFCWPAGYAHYLRDHNVAVEPAFKAMLLSKR